MERGSSQRLLTPFGKVGSRMLGERAPHRFPNLDGGYFLWFMGNTLLVEGFNVTSRF